MLDLLVVLAFLGGIFGVVEVATVAWADEAGHPARAGFVLACYASGSLVAGLTYGVVHPRAPLHRQLLIGCWVMAFCVIGFAIATTGLGLSVVAFVAGLSIAPTLVASFSLVEELVEGSQLTEGLSWLTTGIVIGVAVGAPLAGRAVDAVGPHRAYLTAVVFAFLAAISVTCSSPGSRPGARRGHPPRHRKVRRLQRSAADRAAHVPAPFGGSGDDAGPAAARRERGRFALRPADPRRADVRAAPRRASARSAPG